MLTHLQTAPDRPARVLILGAGGFLAPRLRRLLEAEAIPVLAAGSKEIDLSVDGNCEKLKLLLQPADSVVFISTLTPDRGRDIATLMKNLRMGEQACAALANSHAAHVLYISSDAVYDPRLSLVSEDSCCDPAEFHGLMHLSREKMFSHTCKASGIPLAILRPSAIYGAGDTHNSYGPNRFIRSIRESGKIMIFGQGEEQRDHVYIGDVLQIVRLSLLYRSSGTLNAVSGRAHSFYEVAEVVRRLVRPEGAIETSARSGPVTHRHFDIAAMPAAFPGFAPTPLEDGIRRTLGEIAGAGA